MCGQGSAHLRAHRAPQRGCVGGVELGQNHPDDGVIRSATSRTVSLSAIMIQLSVECRKERPDNFQWACFP
jgi:hypothetical protein